MEADEFRCSLHGVKSRVKAYSYRHKLTMPVLAIGGEKSLGNELAEQMKQVASDVNVVVLKDTGHWLLEERPKETTDALVTFL